MNKLDHMLGPGDGQDDEAVAVAEAMVGVLIYDEMTKRFFDRRSGAVPRFAGRLRKAVSSFEASIR